MRYLISWFVYRMMSDYEVESSAESDNLFEVLFHGPKGSK